MNDPHFEESDDNDDDDAEKEDKDEKINERQQQKRPKRNQPKREHKKFRKQLDDDNDDIMDDEEEEDKKEEEKKEKNEEEEQENEKEVQENKEEVQENEEEVQENKEEEQENDDDDTKRKEEEIEQIPKNIIDMGKDLHILLQNINKIPTPPPSNNPQHSTNEYQSILVTHLSNIDSVDEFSNCREIFIPVESYSSIPIELSNVNKPSSASSILPSPSQKHSATSSLSQKSWLDVILNKEKYVESSYDTDPMDLDNERGEADWDSVDPVTLLDLPDEERTKKQEEACLFITNRIINIYESTLNDQIETEILRRLQFRKLILLLEYYEKLEAYCNLNLKQAKGDTIKAQASKIIIKSSKPSEDQPPQIKGNELTVMTGQALRMRRLLNVASKNYNIFYAFPDLEPQFFLPKKLSVVNYERWLKLVETGELPSVEKGKQLHNEYKEMIKKMRMEKFKF